MADQPGGNAPFSPISLDAARRKKKGRGGDAPVGCKVLALGHRSGMYYFLDVGGQERVLAARQLCAQSELASLFNGDTAWLVDRFPKKMSVKEVVAGETVATQAVIGFSTGKAGAWLMMECAKAGLYGDRTVVRRAGIWASATGAPMVHAGDVVIDAGVHRPPGHRVGSVLFAADEAAPRPAAACGPEVARSLQAGLKELWTWKQPGGEILAIGAIGAGYLGAALRWRPNLFLIGGIGCGKSKMLGVLRAAAPMNFYTNDTTKEGLSQGVNGKAMPMFVDEASDRVDQRGAQALMDLVLAATGDEGAKVRRGTADGRGRSVEVMGVITMASVAPPEMQGQHMARFTMLELRTPQAGDDHKAEMEALTEQARGAGPALWGRALEGWSRWVPALEAFRHALGNAGCAAREMDQMGALLASWWVLTEDGVPGPRDALGGVVAVTEYARRADEVAQDSASRLAVQHLLSCRVQRNHTTDLVPVGELLERAIRAPGEEDTEYVEAAKHLARHGMRVVRADQAVDRQSKRPVPRMAPGDGIWLSNTAMPLQTLFRGTAWEGQRWRFALLGLESARSSSRSVRIGSIPSHAIWVSMSDLAQPDGEVALEDTS